MSKRLQEKTGFTLLEMIVSIGLFSAISLIGVSSLFTLVSVQKKASYVQNLQDNLRFAFESMTTEINYGNTYEYKDTGCPGDCDSDCLSFNSKKESATAFYCLNSGVIEKYKEIAGVGNLIGPITAKEIKITDLVFYVSGEKRLDGKQPKVTIGLKAVAGEESEVEMSVIQLQTTLSQNEISS
ncbi:type II secretion system protein J [Patescibacteria group bacterium]